MRPDGLVIPEGGFQPAPVIPQPNIFPMEWRVDSQKLTEIYERSKLQQWNPSDLPWDDLDPDAFTPEQRIGMMYWFAVLANFDASGPPVFAQAMVHAYEHHEEDPVRKCFFSITRDEVNHEEACGRLRPRWKAASRSGCSPREPGARGRWWRTCIMAWPSWPPAWVCRSFLSGSAAARRSWPGAARSPS